MKNRKKSNRKERAFILDSVDVAYLKQLSDTSASLDAYLPAFDTLKNVISFLKCCPSSSILSASMSKSLVAASASTKKLETSLQRSNLLQKFVNDKLIEWQRTSSSISITRQVLSLKKSLVKFNQQQLEYKEMLRNRNKAERKVAEVLRNSEPFKAFMSKHSYLSGIFAAPLSLGDPVGSTFLTGLLTRTQIQNYLIGRTPTASGSPQALIQSTLSASQSEISALTKKIADLGNNSPDFSLPAGYQPASKKTDLLNRFEVSASFQNSKPNALFPVSSEIGFSVGFKPITKIIIGMGAAGRLGWGSDIRHIHLTGQGLGLRSFTDVRVHKKIFLSGGYEQNYYSEIKKIAQLKHLSGWKPSALAGLSKKYSMGSKRKGEMKFLYDFLARYRMPTTSPFLYRIGFNF